MAAKGKNPSKKGKSDRVISDNRKARHEYNVLETIEAGIVLTGTEIKSLRAGKVSLNEAFAHLVKEEVFLHNCNIPIYKQGNIHNHEPLRARKLLLKKQEIRKLIGKTKEKGLTLIPLKLYFKGPWVKVLLGLCKGKTLHDKRDTLTKRTQKREIERALKSYR